MLQESSGHVCDMLPKKCTDDDCVRALSSLKQRSLRLANATEEAPCGAQVFEEFCGLENGAVKSDKS